MSHSTVIVLHVCDMEEVESIAKHFDEHEKALRIV